MMDSNRRTEPLAGIEHRSATPPRTLGDHVATPGRERRRKMSPKISRGLGVIVYSIFSLLTFGIVNRLSSGQASGVMYHAATLLWFVIAAGFWELMLGSGRAKRSWLTRLGWASVWLGTFIAFVTRALPMDALRLALVQGAAAIAISGSIVLAIQAWVHDGHEVYFDGIW